MDSDTDSDGNRVGVLKGAPNSRTIDESSSEQTIQSDPSFQQRFAGFVGAITQKLYAWKNKKIVSPAQMVLDTDRQKSLIDEFKFIVPEDPYLSPWWAKDEHLKQLPPTHILVCIFVIFLHFVFILN